MTENSNSQSHQPSQTEQLSKLKKLLQDKNSELFEIMNLKNNLKILNPKETKEINILLWNKQYDSIFPTNEDINTNSNQKTKKISISLINYLITNAFDLEIDNEEKITKLENLRKDIIQNKKDIKKSKTLEQISELKKNLEKNNIDYHELILRREKKIELAKSRNQSICSSDLSSYEKELDKKIKKYKRKKIEKLNDSIESYDDEENGHVIKLKNEPEKENMNICTRAKFITSHDNTNTNNIIGNPIKLDAESSSSEEGDIEEVIDLDDKENNFNEKEENLNNNNNVGNILFDDEKNKKGKKNLNMDEDYEIEVDDFYDNDFNNKIDVDELKNEIKDMEDSGNEKNDDSQTDKIDEEINQILNKKTKRNKNSETKVEKKVLFKKKEHFSEKELTNKKEFKEKINNNNTQIFKKIKNDNNNIKNNETKENLFINNKFDTTKKNIIPSEKLKYNEVFFNNNQINTKEKIRKNSLSAITKLLYEYKELREKGNLYISNTAKNLENNLAKDHPKIDTGYQKALTNMYRTLKEIPKYKGVCKAIIQGKMNLYKVANFHYGEKFIQKLTKVNSKAIQSQENNLNNYKINNKKNNNPNNNNHNTNKGKLFQNTKELYFFTSQDTNTKQNSETVTKKTEEKTPIQKYEEEKNESNYEDSIESNEEDGKFSPGPSNKITQKIYNITDENQGHFYEPLYRDYIIGMNILRPMLFNPFKKNIHLYNYLCYNNNPDNYNTNQKIQNNVITNINNKENKENNENSENENIPQIPIIPPPKGSVLRLFHGTIKMNHYILNNYSLFSTNSYEDFRKLPKFKKELLLNSKAKASEVIPYCIKHLNHLTKMELFGWLEPDISKDKDDSEFKKFKEMIEEFEKNDKCVCLINNQIKLYILTISLKTGGKLYKKIIVECFYVDDKNMLSLTKLMIFVLIANKDYLDSDEVKDCNKLIPEIIREIHYNENKDDEENEELCKLLKENSIELINSYINKNFKHLTVAEMNEKLLKLSDKNRALLLERLKNYTENNNNENIENENLETENLENENVKNENKMDIENMNETKKNDKNNTDNQTQNKINENTNNKKENINNKNENINNKNENINNKNENVNDKNGNVNENLNNNLNSTNNNMITMSNNMIDMNKNNLTNNMGNFNMNNLSNNIHNNNLNNNMNFNLNNNMNFNMNNNMNYNMNYNQYMNPIINDYTCGMIPKMNIGMYQDNMIPMNSMFINPMVNMNKNQDPQKTNMDTQMSINNMNNGANIYYNQGIPVINPYNGYK